MLRFALLNSKPISTVFLLSLFFQFPISWSGPTTDYCDLNCKDEYHTVCKRNRWCGAKKPCVAMQSDVAFRTHMLKAHNEVRENIASGKVKEPYGNTGAKDMNVLSYDMEMEYVAACWNNMCKKVEHDVCRKSLRFSVGQNLFWGSNVNETAESVPSWFNEINQFTDAKWLESFANSNYPKDDFARGHFTQLIWAKTKYVGCSRVRYGESSPETQLICNYGTAGNVLGQSIYKMAGSEAEVGSACEGGKNSEYPSLCGTIEPIPTEDSWAAASQLQPLSFFFFLSLFPMFCL